VLGRWAGRQRRRRKEKASFFLKQEGAEVTVDLAEGGVEQFGGVDGHTLAPSVNAVLKGGEEGAPGGKSLLHLGQALQVEQAVFMTGPNPWLVHLVVLGEGDGGGQGPLREVLVLHRVSHLLDVVPEEAGEGDGG
jgi:hypothetical protein